MRKRDKLGVFIRELDEPALIKFYCERYDRDWLREEALKKKLSISGLLRGWIKKLRK